MAKTLASVFKTGSVFLNNISKSTLHLPTRHLYAQTTLGIDNFIQAREKVKTQFAAMTDKFREKMTEYCNDTQGKYLIFTEDLKNMVHLAEADKNDINLVIQMITKFNKQNKEMRFGNFVFGTVVMRLFYYLNDPDSALECFKNPELQGFFDQLMTYQLLLDLLYENGRYDDVLNTFDLIKNRQIQGTKYPKNIVVITMGACYKLNTPESLKHALDLWKELQDVGHLPMRRASTFCAGLALNQGKSDIALEIVTGAKKQNYMTVRNIKAVALADIGRIDESLQILRSVLEIDDPNNIKHTFSKDVLEKIKLAVEKQDKVDVKREFERIEKYLVEQGHITDTTLDQQLCSTITSPPVTNNSKYQQTQQKTVPRYQYQGNQSRNNNYRVYNQKPGLEDMQ